MRILRERFVIENAEVECTMQVKEGTLHHLLHYAVMEIALFFLQLKYIAKNWTWIYRYPWQQKSMQTSLHDPLIAGTGKLYRGVEKLPLNSSSLFSADGML